MMVRILCEARHVPVLPVKLGLTQHPAVQAAHARGLVGKRHRLRYLRQSSVSSIYRVDLGSQFDSKAPVAEAHNMRRQQDLRAQQMSMPKSMPQQCHGVTRESVRMAAVLDHFRTISVDGRCVVFVGRDLQPSWSRRSPMRRRRG